MPNAKRFVPATEWRNARQRRGLWGERIAIAYLTACGWGIEAHRFRLGRHDLDLVIRRESLVAFVEVKTRGSKACGEGIEAVTAAKRRILARTAAAWRARFGRAGDRYRFDVLTVQLGSGPPRLEHLEDAWRLGSTWLA